jgi:tetratricopeptide (TPR) repeat protein
MATSGELEKLLIMGEALLQTNNSDGALMAYNKALGYDPANKTALAGKTISLLAQGNLEEALINSDLAAQRQPNDSSIWNLFGTTALVAGKGELALKAFSTSQKLAGTTAGNFIRLAESAYLALDIERARRFIDLAIQKQPASEEAKLWQEKLATLKDRVTILIDVGKAHYRLWRIQQGVELFREAVALGDSKTARLNLARGLLILGQLQEAITHLRLVLQHDPNNMEALIELANGYFLSGESEKARESYVGVLSLNPNNLDSFIGMARISLKSGNLNEAANYIEQALGQASNHPEVWVLKAQLSSTQGESAKVRQSVDHAIALDITFIPTWAIGVEILRKHGMNALADLYWYKVHKMVPIKFETKTSGEQLTGVESEAADLANISDPEKFEEICRDRAVIYTEIDRPERALFYLNLLSKKYPQRADEQLINQQGALLLDIGKIQEARQRFERVLSLNHSNETAQRGLIAITNVLEKQIELSKLKEQPVATEKILVGEKIEPVPQQLEQKIPTGMKLPENKDEAVLRGKPKPQENKKEAKSYCRKCGNKLGYKAKFCNKCGTQRR